jgi:hypothetical protein
VTPQFLSAEPIANNVLAVTTQGAVDLSKVKVTQNGKVGSCDCSPTFGALLMLQRRPSKFSAIPHIFQSTLLPNRSLTSHLRLILPRDIC